MPEAETAPEAPGEDAWEPVEIPYVPPTGPRVRPRKYTPASARARPDKALTLAERAFRPEALRILAEHEPFRPRTRGACKDGPRPCPWVSCKHHLAVDTTDGGAARVRFPAIGEAWEEDAIDWASVPDSCVLDVADRVSGGEEIRLVDIAERMNLTITSAIEALRDAEANLRSRLRVARAD